MLLTVFVVAGRVLSCGGQRRTVVCALVGLRNVIVKAVIFCCHSYYLMFMVPTMGLLLIPLFRLVSECINISSVIRMITFLYSAMIYSLGQSYLNYCAGFGRILSFCGRS